MKKETILSEVGRQYAAAYKAQYTTKDLHEALQLYKSVMVEYPDTIEAGYSCAQIQNIANAVIPKQELCDAQCGLALSHATNG